jgi:hypothetical protein
VNPDHLSMESIRQSMDEAEIQTFPAAKFSQSLQQWEAKKKRGSKKEDKLCTIPGLQALVVFGDQICSKDGGVYFIQSGKQGAIKIGTARDIRARRISLQIGNPEYLYIVAYIPLKYSYERAERVLQKYFADHRVRGEWFEHSIVLAFLRGENAT